MVLGSLINHPDRLNRETLYELRNIVARYPYFQTARLLLLNNLYLLHEPDFGAELRRSVLYVSDRRALYRLVGGYKDAVEPDALVMAEEPGIDRTLSLIDAFLDTLPEEHSAAPLHAVDVAGDYVARYLTDKEPAVQGDDSLHLIDRFLTDRANETVAVSAVQPKARDVSENVEETLSTMAAEQELESLDENYFTETLAKIYIKQHKYSRALEIIRSLYLQFPEKNAYFADQIRFLEKLIINNNSK